MLPTMFQGLALPNPNIGVLSGKLHLVQNEWGTDGVMGKLLSQAYQVFQVDVGFMVIHLTTPLRTMVT